MDLSPGGLVTIAAKEKIWYFPPPFLEVYDDLSSLPWSNPLPHVNNLEALSNYLKKNPDQVQLASTTCLDQSQQHLESWERVLRYTVVVIQSLLQTLLEQVKVP